MLDVPGHARSARTAASARRPLFFALATLAASCTVLLASVDAAARTASRPRASGSVALDEDAAHAFVADVDNQALHEITLPSGEVRSLALPCAPEQVLILEDQRLAVTLRGCDRVAIVDRRTLETLATASVAPDPWGLAQTSSGELLVTSAFGRTLTALDGRTLAPHWAVGTAREPRSITLSPDGTHAWITHLVGSSLSVVDLASEAHGVTSLSVLSADHRDRVDAAIGAKTQHPVSSLSYAAALSEDGTRLFVPHLAVQNGERVVHATPGSYGGVPIEEDTTAASVSVIGTRSGLVLAAPRAERDPTRGAVALGAGFSPVAVAPSPVAARQARAAVVTGDRLLVVSQGTGELYELSARSFDPALGASRAFAVGAGPSGVDADGDLAVVWSQFDHVLSLVDLRLGATVRLSVASDPLAPEVAAGRRLFHAEDDRRLSRDGRACAGCHPEGRDDGIVWHLGMGPRQTPTLVGRLERGPFGWNGHHAKLSGNMRETIGRLGGRGLFEKDLDALAAYLTRGLAAPRRPADQSERVVLRGKELFHSEAVGCASCHVPGGDWSDHARHDVASKTPKDQDAALRTPPLLFVADTAPYFHDGRYATLEDMLRDNHDRMGRTMMLSEPDLDALAAFLRTL